MSIPVVDISPLIDKSSRESQVADAIHRACRDHGFFYIAGHGVDTTLQLQLEELSWQFFNLNPKTKHKVRMELGGRAWRGYFAVGDELTSGVPDQKEGLYFGEELRKDHPRVVDGTPMHGPNMFPSIEGIKEIILDYMEVLTSLGHILMRGIALSLKLPPDYFDVHFLRHPLILFRIFHYPPQPDTEPSWGVGEHTDYGLLTILKQDKVGGLQVKSAKGWLDAPYIENTFICNIGDMLDLLTSGYYRSTPHRVLNTSGVGRLSFPFFFDPDFYCQLRRVDLGHLPDFKPTQYHRWDGAELQTVRGTYGQYLVNKIKQVFPDMVSPDTVTNKHQRH